MIKQVTNRAILNIDMLNPYSTDFLQLPVTHTNKTTDNKNEILRFKITSEKSQRQTFNLMSRKKKRNGHF